MVKIRFFASLKDLVGQSEMEFELNEETTVRHIFEELAVRFQGLSAYERVLLVAVNQTYSNLDAPLAPGDELAFFPPVSGGAS